MSRSDIKGHMESIGADGVHVGTVDGVEGDSIKLTKADSGQGRRPLPQLRVAVASWITRRSTDPVRPSSRSAVVPTASPSGVRSSSHSRHARRLTFSSVGPGVFGSKWNRVFNAHPRPSKRTSRSSGPVCHSATRPARDVCGKSARSTQMSRPCRGRTIARNAKWCR